MCQMREKSSSIHPVSKIFPLLIWLIKLILEMSLRPFSFPVNKVMENSRNLRPKWWIPDCLIQYTNFANEETEEWENIIFANVNIRRTDTDPFQSPHSGYFPRNHSADCYSSQGFPYPGRKTLTVLMETAKALSPKRQLEALCNCHPVCQLLLI